jgi:hypothetical protein
MIIILYKGCFFMDNKIYGINKNDIEFNFKKIDKILEIDGFNLEICLIGGIACILSNIENRYTIDYDLLNMDYSPQVRSYLNLFNPYDLVDFEATTIPKSYKERLKIVYNGKYIKCYILSIEDIIVSKLCRNYNKDFKDIDVLIKTADIQLIKALINETKSDIGNRYPRIEENFEISVKRFYNKYKNKLL